MFKNNITFKRDENGLHWSISMPEPINLKASGIILAAEGLSPQQEKRAVVTALRKQFEEWEKELRLA